MLLQQLQAAQQIITRALRLPLGLAFFWEREYNFPLLLINDCCVVVRWESADIRKKQPGVK